MNYDKILNDTLLAIKSMPTEKFEEICIRHGYTPTRKETIEDSEGNQHYIDGGRDYTKTNNSDNIVKLLVTKNGLIEK